MTIEMLMNNMRRTRYCLFSYLMNSEEMQGVLLYDETLTIYFW